MKHLLFILLLAFSFGCKTTIKAFLPPDTIEIFTDSPLIKAGWSEKKQSYSFSFMKKKMSRSKFVRQLNNLNNEAFNYYKTGKMNSDEYSVYAEGSRVLTQILWYFTAYLDDGKKAIDLKEIENIIKSSKSIAFPNEKMGKYINELLNKARVLSETNEGIFEQLIKQIIVILDDYLKQFRSGN